MKEFFIFIKVACLCHIISTQSDVRLPPAITRWTQLRKLWYNNGSKLILECGAEGTPAVQYEWRKNGFQINTNLPNIRKESDGTIAINKATVIDEGYYQCVSKNQYGTALSNTIHVQMETIEYTAGAPIVLQKTVVEGMPFHIETHRTSSSQFHWFGWERADVNSSEYFTRVWPSKRIQIAFNGDLHFAYALLEDARGVKIYRSTSLYETTSQQTRTQLTVTRNPAGNISQFAPTLAFSSEAQTVALVGESLRLSCFFYGYPEPKISWTGPRNTQAFKRYSVTPFDTTLTISKVSASDEGNYSCTGTNTQGSNTRTLQIRVEAAPEFKNTTDGPYNVNVTEGESVTFKCNVFAIPEANIVWLKNGQPIDTANPPKRFVFSNDMKNLTIRDVCRDCVDRESKTDLMVIQCNASNVHGYAFASGYLNVLMKTKVTITISQNMSFDLLEKKQFIIRCKVTSDPSTALTVRWYKTEPFGDLVGDEPPYVYLKNDELIITIDTNCSNDCAKCLGEYRCIGETEYSRDSGTITLPYNDKASPDEHVTKNIAENRETWGVWKTILVAGAIGLVLFLIGILLHFRWKRRFGDVNRRTTEKRMPNPVDMYEYVGYESVGQPLEEIVGSNKILTRKESGEYEHIGYDSIDQVLEEVANREVAMPKSLDEYESLDVPERETTGGGKLTLDRNITCDEMGYSLPLEQVTNACGQDQQQLNGYESVQSESEKFPKSNDQQESKETYLDLYQEQVTDNLDLKKSDVNRQKVKSHSDLASKEENQYLDLVSNQVNQYLDLDPSHVDPYLDLTTEELNQSLDLDPKEVNQYLDLVSNEVNQYLDLDSKEVDRYLDLSPKEMNQYLDLDPKELNQHLDPDAKEVERYLDPSSKNWNQHRDLEPNEVDLCLDQGPREMNIYLDLGPESREVNQYMGIGPKEVNEYIGLGPKEVNQNTSLSAKHVNQYKGPGPREVNEYIGLGQKEENQ